jgi:hypothetical protein
VVNIQYLNDEGQLKGLSVDPYANNNGLQGLRILISQRHPQLNSHELVYEFEEAQYEVKTDFCLKSALLRTNRFLAQQIQGKQ